MENQKYEDALKRLEEIVAALEDGSKPLDETLKMFEEGTKLLNFCNKSLNEAEQKVVQLSMPEVEENTDDIKSD